MVKLEHSLVWVVYNIQKRWYLCFKGVEETKPTSPGPSCLDNAIKWKGVNKTNHTIPRIAFYPVESVVLFWNTRAMSLRADNAITWDNILLYEDRSCISCEGDNNYNIKFSHARNWILMGIINTIKNDNFCRLKQQKPVHTLFSPYKIKQSSLLCKWIYESSYIWTAENDMKICLIIAVIHAT